MGRLHIELLGGLTLKQDGKVITAFKSRKAEALLVYLASHTRPFPREELATTFWGDSEPKQAMANLRKVLTDLRRHAGDFLIVERKTIAFNFDGDYWLDVAEFKQYIKAASDRPEPNGPDRFQEMEKAVSLYNGDFLAGFYLRESYQFDEWASMQRERLRLAMTAVLEQLVYEHLHHQRYQPGVAYARRLLALDPLHEASHRLLMRLLARRGQRSAALAQYTACERILAEELDVSPMPETTAVYERIRQAPERPFHFPAIHSPIVGRDREVAQISKYLDEDGVQLITLVGPGGIGKTRLALAATADRASEYRHGIYLVQLTGHKDDHAAQPYLVSAIADALNLSFSGTQAPAQQLVDYLSQKEMLLLLDNFEHLLPATGVINTLLSRAAQITCLVTSRQPLNLPREKRFNLTGLPYPTPTEQPDGTQYGALQLFEQQAQRARPGFVISAENQADIVRICELVHGLPLGLELAAAATRAFPPEQIVQQLQRNLDFLATRARDLPPRHRSARAVFNYAWQLLNETEQAQFSKLAVFRGGFTLEAAAQVTQSSRPLLNALTAKSMLRVETSGRYQVHELLRQYGVEQLQASTTTYEAINEAHGRYFARLLQAQGKQLLGPDQKDALERIRQDLDNIRAAWQWALEQQTFAFIADVVEPLFRFYLWHGRFQEGFHQFQQAANALHQITDLAPKWQGTLARLSIRQGIMAHLLARYDEAARWLTEGETLAETFGLWNEIAHAHLYKGQLAFVTQDFAGAETAFEQSLALYRQTGDRHGEGQTLAQLGRLSFALGRYDQAQVYFQDCLTLQQDIGNPRGMAQAFTGLASVLQYRSGDYAAAEKLHQKGLAINQELGDVHGLAVGLTLLGNLACSMGNFQRAIDYYEQGLAYRREIGAPRGIAITLGNLGTVYHELKQYDKAREMYEESLAMSRRIDDQVGVVFCLSNLAELAHAQGHYELSEKQWVEALKLGHQLQIPDRMLYSLMGLAALWLNPATAVHDQKRGTALLQYVINHEDCNQGIKEEAKRLFPDILDTLPVASDARDLTEVVSDLLENYANHPPVRQSTTRS